MPVDGDQLLPRPIGHRRRHREISQPAAEVVKDGVLHLQHAAISGGMRDLEGVAHASQGHLEYLVLVAAKLAHLGTGECPMLCQYPLHPIHRETRGMRLIGKLQVGVLHTANIAEQAASRYPAERRAARGTTDAPSRNPGGPPARATREQCVRPSPPTR